MVWDIINPSRINEIEQMRQDEPSDENPKSKCNSKNRPWTLWPPYKITCFKLLEWPIFPLWAISVHGQVCTRFMCEDPSRLDVVMCWAGPQALSPEPSPFKPKPSRALTRACSGLGLGFRFQKPEPEAQARALIHYGLVCKYTIRKVISKP